jgi:hypothetical protein
MVEPAPRHVASANAAASSSSTRGIPDGRVTLRDPDRSAPSRRSSSSGRRLWFKRLSSPIASRILWSGQGEHCCHFGPRSGEGRCLDDDHHGYRGTRSPAAVDKHLVGRPACLTCESMQPPDVECSSSRRPVCRPPGPATGLRHHPYRTGPCASHAARCSGSASLVRAVLVARSCDAGSGRRCRTCRPLVTYAIYNLHQRHRAQSDRCRPGRGSEPNPSRPVARTPGR